MSAWSPARWLVRNEGWLPVTAGAAWWVAMYPGLYGEDSLINLTEAQHGPVSVWFTAWWVYVIRAVTLGVTAIPLLTLGGVLTLAWATCAWARASLPEGWPRALALVVICATPLVGALGIQVRHDIPMTAGLLLLAAVMTRSSRSRCLTRADGWLVSAAALLIATRHNGLPTVLGVVALSAACAASSDRRRFMVLGVAAAAIIVAVTQAATWASGNSRSMDPVQSVEWALADISCLLSAPGVEVTPGDAVRMTAIADPADWPNRQACRSINNGLLYARTFNRDAVAVHQADIFRLWASLAARYPRLMLAAHVERVRLFLPPFVAGAPRDDQMPFIHSTILPNAFGLSWRFPRAARTVRLAARAWNAGKNVMANAGLWLLALGVCAWRGRSEPRSWLTPTMLVALSLEFGILLTAPISEGRYGLFILICGQTATLTALLHLGNRWLHTTHTSFP